MLEPTTIHDFCRGILESGDLDRKLRPPGANLLDAPAEPLYIAAPTREPAISLQSGGDKLPRPGALHDPVARARCLARFAHHELQAAELFAWALLRWPEAPPALRQALVSVLRDEQRHCRMYLDRLATLGTSLAEHARPGYFWRHADTLTRAPGGLRSFLAAMGLTLEQANLDFAPLYRDGFEAAGDSASAAVCEAVHRDEIRHVRLANHWLQTLTPGRTDLDAYLDAAPFPFAGNRAKGRRFEPGARREAGLSEAFIEHVRHARSQPGRR